MHEKQISPAYLPEAQRKHAKTLSTHDFQLWVTGPKRQGFGLLNRTRRFDETSYSLQKDQQCVIRNLLLSLFGNKNLAKPASMPDEPHMEEKPYKKLQIILAFWTTDTEAPRLYR